MIGPDDPRYSEYLPHARPVDVDEEAEERESRDYFARLDKIAAFLMAARAGRESFEVGGAEDAGRGSGLSVALTRALGDLGVIGPVREWTMWHTLLNEGTDSNWFVEELRAALEHGAVAPAQWAAIMRRPNEGDVTVADFGALVAELEQVMARRAG